MKQKDKIQKLIQDNKEKGESQKDSIFDVDTAIEVCR